ncbi:MAG: GNAT family N-acetyltransferase [Phycisphaeraceae bacterium]|nr:GNAT family N-acetyltransferase [Phycisphaeraceae bacterium]
MTSVTRMTKSDFDQIMGGLRDFWGADSDRLRTLNHPMFLYEFGDTAFVVRDGDKVIAYLMGMLSQTEPVGYVHMVAVHADHRRQGLARTLYAAFEACVAAKGCQTIKAITPPSQTGSIQFHRSIGMNLCGHDSGAGFPVVKDYWGLGGDRVVFTKPVAKFSR